ncbi:MAG: hypothetical protein ACE5JA_04665 [bacterium]
MAKKMLKDRRVLSQVLKGISSEVAEIKYGCARVLKTLSEKNPEVLYQKWGFFVDMLDSDNAFLRCGAVVILANLTKVDSKGQFEKLFNKFYKLIDGEGMVTAANVVKASGTIARAKPELQSMITDRLLSIDRTHHRPECKDVIKGHAILALGEYFKESRDKKKILEFMRRELRNARPATRKKAGKFLRKWGSAMENCAAEPTPEIPPRFGNPPNRD